MRGKRMFSLDVVDTDNFLEMPASTQALYFHLGMRADDDGFVDSPKKITNMVNCGNDDYKLLIAKGYVIPLRNGIIVITHWKQNNYIRSDRYIKTKHIEELSMLSISDGKYQYSDPVSVDGIPDGSQAVDSVATDCHTQIKLDKVKLNKKDYSVHFEALWSAYPRKKEKSRAYKCYNARLNDGYTEQELLDAVKKYAEECRKQNTEERYIKLPGTFLGANTPFVDYLRTEEPHEKSGSSSARLW